MQTSNSLVCSAKSSLPAHHSNAIILPPRTRVSWRMASRVCICSHVCRALDFVNITLCAQCSVENHQIRGGTLIKPSAGSAAAAACACIAAPFPVMVAHLRAHAPVPSARKMHRCPPLSDMDLHGQGRKLRMTFACSSYDSREVPLAVARYWRSNEFTGETRESGLKLRSPSFLLNFDKDCAPAIVHLGQCPSWQ